MKFVHDDPEFGQLLTIVSRQVTLPEALVEKDYWVTHSLWALHQAPLKIWFKGGTSLSKGFNLIQRFSEDLDLMIEPSDEAQLPAVTSWTSMNKGRVAQRRAFYDELGTALTIPGVEVSQDTSRLDKTARSAEYLGYYPGLHTDTLDSVMSPFVRLEVGRARVVPYVAVPLTSFVHEHLAKHEGLGADYIDNRPQAVHCVHPWVTLLEKLDALMRRYGRNPMQAHGFVRHYGDAAAIIDALDRLPPAGVTLEALATDMLADGGLQRMPSPGELAWNFEDDDKRRQINEASEQTAPMHWGARQPIEQSCQVIREWLSHQTWTA